MTTAAVTNTATTKDTPQSLTSLSQFMALELGYLGFFGLQIVCTGYQTTASEPYQSKNTLEKHFVLVKQKDVFVLGLLFTVYSTSPNPLIYIDKLDSCGLFESIPSVEASLSRSIVHSFLKAYPGHRLHVFARAQPEFLFPYSAKNPRKNILSERKLVQFWAKTLGSVQDTVKGWYFVPGESQFTTRDIGSKLLKVWEYGWPWDKSAVASKAIPHFSDDAKTKALDLIGPQGTISDFEEILSRTGECGSDRFSGFFILDLKEGSKKVSTDWISQEDFEKVQNILLSSDFELRSKAVKSSEKVYTMMASLGVKGVDVVCTKSFVKTLDLGKGSEKPETCVKAQVPAEPEKRVNVFNASHLVKKKKVV